jgi:hypothetical protein
MMLFWIHLFAASSSYTLDMPICATVNLLAALSHLVAAKMFKEKEEWD